MAARYKAGDEPVPGYRLVAFLGEGGIGQVWKAVCPGKVFGALKIINLGQQQGLKEFRALELVKSLHHPNLVPINAFWLEDSDGSIIDDPSFLAQAEAPPEQIAKTRLLGAPIRPGPAGLIIAMGLGEMSLMDRLEQHRAAGAAGIPPAELLSHMEDAAKAIDFLNEPRHALGDGKIGAIQHGDIKPQNIMIVGGSAQVADFGLARVVGDLRATSAGVTPAYAAPESIEGEPPAPTTDQYSLAITYFELRTGSLPFAALTHSAVIRAHLMGQLDLSLLTPDEAKVVRRASARDPALRFGSCRKFVQALRQAVPESDPLTGSGEVKVSKPPDATTRTDGSRGKTIPFAPRTESEVERHDEPPPRSRRRKLLLALALLAVVGIAAAVPIVRAKQLTAEVQASIEAGKYETAHEQLNSADRWFAWAVDNEGLKASIEDHWLARIDAALKDGNHKLAAELIAMDLPSLSEQFKKERLARQEQLSKSEVRVAIASTGMPDRIKRPPLKKPPSKQPPAIPSAQPQRSTMPTDPEAAPAVPIPAQPPEPEMAVTEPVKTPPAAEPDDNLFNDEPDEPAESMVEPAAETPKTPSEILLAAEKSLNAARTALVTDRKQSLAHYSEGIEFLEILARKGGSDDETNKQVGLLRRQLLITRARAELELADWTSAVDDVALAEAPIDADDKLTRSQVAMITLIRAVAGFHLEGANPKILKRLAETEKAMEAAADEQDLDFPCPLALESLAVASEGAVRDVRSKIDDSALKLSQRLALSQALVEYRPADSAILLALADLQVEGASYSAAVETLLRARSAADDAAIAKKIDAQLPALRALVLVASPPKEKLLDLTAPSKAVADLDHPRREALQREYCRLLIALARKDKRYVEQALEQMPGLLAKLTPGEPTEELRKQFSTLRDGRASSARQALLDALAAPTPSYDSITGLCIELEKTAGRDALTIACRAECVLEGPGDGLPYEKWLPIQKVVFADTVRLDGELEHYLSYVRGLVLAREPRQPDWTQAANLISSAAQSRGGVTLNAHRKQRAVEILTTAAEQLRVPDAKLDFAHLLEGPYADAETADAAFRWLDQAASLSKTEDASLKCSRALSAYYMTEPDRELAQRLLSEAAPSFAKLDRSQIPLLHVWLNVSEPGDDRSRAEKLAGYAELLRLAGAEKADAGKEIPPVELYERVIAPALSLAADIRSPTALPAESRATIASLYAAKGSLLRQHRREGWKIKDIAGETFDAFDKALSFNERAEYFAGRGWASLGLKTDLPAVEADARSAVAKDERFAGGHALLGNVQILQARASKQAQQRTTLLASAIESCSQALTLVADDSQETACALVHRGTALVDLSSYSSEISTEERLALLKHAAANARRAAEIDSPYRGQAYLTLGGALEDMAWLGGDSNTRYLEAADAFTRAIEIRSDAVDWMSRGRCNFRAAAYGGLPERLDQAARDLAEALKRDPESGDASYWLGRVEFERRNYKPAELHLQQAIATQGTHGRQYWLARALVEQGKTAEADEVFQQAIERAAAENSVLQFDYLMHWAVTVPLNSNSPGRAKAVTAVASRYRQAPAAEAIFFVGLARELGRDFQGAVTLYSAALKARPAVWEPKDLESRILLRRHEVRFAPLRELESTDRAAAKRLAKEMDSKMYADADEAAKRAPSKALQAEAAAESAEARALGGKLLNDNKLLREAVEQYRAAIKLDPKHPQGWSWRFDLVREWSLIDQTLPRREQAYREAKGYLDEALSTMPADHPDRPALGRLHDELDRKHSGK